MWCLYCALFSSFVYRYLCADMMFGMLCFVLLLSFPEKRKKKKEEKNPPTAPDRFAQTWFNCILSRHTNMVTAMMNKKGETKLYFQTGILFITCCLTLPDNTECHSFSLKVDYFSGSKIRKGKQFTFLCCFQMMHCSVHWGCGGFRKPWNCKSVHLIFVCTFYGTVVTQLIMDLDSVTRTVCAQSPLCHKKIQTSLQCEKLQNKIKHNTSLC